MRRRLWLTRGARALSTLVLLCLALGVGAARAAFEPFVVSDIRVEGLQRIAAGTVFNYLPVKVGDTLTVKGAQDAVRALYKTGFFKDVRLERDGQVLVVSVVERPSIAEIRINGTKEISEEDLKKSLKEIGLAEGRVYNKSLLDRIEQELRQQYFSRGFYAVVVRPVVTPIERNRVNITLDVAEGSAARIRQLAIIGNEAFSDSELEDAFTLGPAPWWAIFSSRDQYAKQKLAGDLERLRNFYQDRGYLEFSIDSTQVSITPERDQIYVTVNITEGKKYTISGYKLAGKFPVPEEELRALVTLQPGQVFSRKQVTENTKRISDRLANDGYAYANVNAVPDINKEKSEVMFTLFVDPGKRVYIRRINFAGNTITRDEVMRRELRLPEGSWYSAEKIQRSRVRLQRLGYFDDVNIETPAVPGSADQVDINVTVKERSTGNLLLGVGYSDADGFLVNASISQRNLFGTGKEMAFTFDNSRSTTNFNLRYVDPYQTPDGVSQGLQLYSTSFDAAATNAAAYNSKTQGAGMFWTLPLSELHSIQFGADVERARITPSVDSAQVAQDFVAQYGESNAVLKTTVAWARDSLNNYLYPSDGSILKVSGELTVPGSDLQYYKATFSAGRFWPLTEALTFKMRGELGYGDGYFDTDELPFYKNFYAGGSSSVRGFRSRSLGPRDPKLNDPIGGPKRLLGNAELLFPMPGDTPENRAMRLSLFVDTGMAYAQSQPIDLAELRYSSGLAFNWFSPVGPLSFSYAWPLNDKPGDEIERFQFTLGVPLR